MRIIDTKAVKITEETYPIAVACLAAGFATLPWEMVRGGYLVINELDAKHFSESTRPVLTVSNGWMEEDHFRTHWRFIEKERAGKFVSVEKVKN